MHLNESIQPTKMSCRPFVVKEFMDIIQPFNQSDVYWIIDEISGIKIIWTTPRKWEKVFNKHLNLAWYQCIKKWNTSRSDVEKSLGNNIPVPCLIVEDSSKNPHATSQESIYNIHYVIILEVNWDEVIIRDPFYDEPQKINKKDFEDQRSFANIPLSTKAKIFKKLWNIQANTSFLVSEKEFKLPLKLRPFTRINDKWREFKSLFYLDYDRKKTVIEKSIQDWTLGKGATDVETRSELLENLLQQEKTDITVTMWTWSLFGRYIREIEAIHARLQWTNKSIVEVIWWSSWSFALVMWALWYKDQKSIDFLCQVPKRLTSDFEKVKKNSAYIIWTKMLPFTTRFDFVSEKSEDLNKEGLREFLMHHFEDIFDILQLFIAWGGLEVSWWFIQEHQIIQIVKLLSEKFPKEFELKTWISIEEVVNITAHKISYKDLHDKVGVDIGTLVAAKWKWDWWFKSIKLSNKNFEDVHVLDWLMWSSNVWKPLTLNIWWKSYKVKDPYFTTKTTAEQEVNEMISNNRCHIALVTLNNFRLNPKDRLVTLWLRSKNNTSQRFYADAVLAPNFKDLNSFTMWSINDIDEVINNFTQDDPKSTP